MIVLLKGQSKMSLGYTLDWIQFDSPLGDLTLDAQGCIEYDDKNCDMRFKGVLVPWSLWKDDSEVACPEDIDPIPYIEKATEVRVGLYPVTHTDDNLELAKLDNITELEGELATDDGKTFSFKPFYELQI